MTQTVSLEDRNSANECLDSSISFSMCGKLDQAINAAEKALEYDPEFPQAYNKLGDYYMKKGWIQRAADSFAKSIELDPSNENSHFDLGCSLTHLGEYDKALEALKTALSIKPKHYEIYGHIGQIHLQTGNAEKAIESFEMARKGDKFNLMATFNLGIAMLQTGRSGNDFFNAVIEKYQQLVNMKSRYAEGNYYIGRSLFYMGRIEKAIKFLELAVEYDTEEVDYHYSFGMLYSDADAFYALAEAQYENGKSSEAKESIKSALQLEPDKQAFIDLKNKIGG